MKDPFNQTRMELKLSMPRAADDDDNSFNQTRMELKHELAIKFHYALEDF